MEQQLGGNIVLSGFELDESEEIVAKKMVGTYAKKLRILSPYEELKIELKIHKKIDKNDFELKGHVIYNGFSIQSESRDINPLVALDALLKNLISEAEHKLKK